MRPRSHFARVREQFFTAALASLLVAACTPPPPDFLSATPSEPIRIEASHSVDAAIAAVQRAAADSGFIVTSVQPGIVTVGPYQIPKHPDVAVTLRANVIASDSGSTILVSGTGTDALSAMMTSSIGGRAAERIVEGRPIEHSTRGRLGWQFAELTRFVQAVRARIESAP